MTDQVIRIVLDPSGVRVGAQQVRGDLESIQATAEQQSESLRDIAESAQVGGEAVREATSGTIVAYKDAAEAVGDLTEANQNSVGTVIEAADRFGEAAEAADTLTDTAGDFDDLSQRIKDLSDRADSLGGDLSDAGEAANDAVGGVSGSISRLRAGVIGLAAVGVAIAAIGIAAVATREQTRENFRLLSRDVLDLGRATLAGLRQVLGPVGNLIDGAIDATRDGVNRARDAILDLAGVTDFVTTEQRLINEAFSEGTRLSEEFGSNAVQSINDIAVSALNASDALGLSTGELIRFNANLAITEAGNRVFDDYSQAISDLQADLEAGTIEQIEYNAAASALSQGLQTNIQNLEAAEESARRYADELATATERQERIGDALQTLNSLQSEQSVFDKQLEDLRFLLDEGEILLPQYVDAVKEALSRLDEEQIEIDPLRQIAEQGAAEIQGAFADFLFDPFNDGLDQLVVNFANALQRMAAEALTQQIFASLFPGAGAGGGGGLADIFSGIFGGGRASGGGVRADQAFMVGESGPEIFVPPTAGSIIPNGQMGMNAAPQVNNSTQVVNVFDESMIPQAMASGAGEQVVLNIITSNPDVVRAAGQQ